MTYERRIPLSFPESAAPRIIPSSALAGDAPRVCLWSVTEGRARSYERGETIPARILAEQGPTFRPIAMALAREVGALMPLAFDPGE